MRVLIFASLLFSVALGAGAQDVPSEAPQRSEFLAAYNQQRAEKRLAAIGILERSKEQASIETLYFVSFRDPDPEVRSLAFATLVHCADEFGYTAYLAADSFKREKEFGVKVEKAVEMGSLQYKWSALNELVEFLSTLRWSYWNWYSNGNGTHGGYIADGTPPEIPSDSSTKPDDSAKPPEKNDKKTNDTKVGDGYDGNKRERLRWRNENELMGLITGTINRMSGTQMESRPRIDQEIVKWWERKSELWVEYDRKLRTSKLPKWKDLQFKSPTEPKGHELKPGTDTLRELLADPKQEKAAPAKKVRGVEVDDE